MKRAQLSKESTKRSTRSSISEIDDAVTASKAKAALKAEMDDILADMDEILEANTTAMGITAEQMVSRFIQANGE